MSEKIEKYTSEEAFDEASRMKEKIESGEAENYDDAEKIVEQETTKEEVDKGGELADLAVSYNNPIDFRVLDKEHGFGVSLSKFSHSDRNNMTKSILLRVCVKGDDGTVFEKTIFEADVYSYNAEDRGSYQGGFGSSIKGEGDGRYGKFEPDKQYDRIEEAEVINNELIIRVHAPANRYAHNKERVDTYKFDMNKLKENDDVYRLDKEVENGSFKYSTAEGYEKLGLKEKAKETWIKLAEKQLTRSVFLAAECYRKADMYKKVKEVLLEWADREIENGKESGLVDDVYLSCGLTRKEMEERIKKLKKGEKL